ncbi:MAG: hypothetical protein ACOC2W_01080 [bacterium]
MAKRRKKCDRLTRLSAKYCQRHKQNTQKISNTTLSKYNRKNYVFSYNKELKRI